MCTPLRVSSSIRRHVFAVIAAKDKYLRWWLVYRRKREKQWVKLLRWRKRSSDWNIWMIWISSWIPRTHCLGRSKHSIWQRSRSYQQHCIDSLLSPTKRTTIKAKILTTQKGRIKSSSYLKKHNSWIRNACSLVGSNLLIWERNSCNSQILKMGRKMDRYQRFMLLILIKR